MCGVVAVKLKINPKRSCIPTLLEMLRRLEYRGYDSAGVAFFVDGKIERIRAAGELDNLAEKIEGETIESLTGIGHTRWATHGVPDETNAHPHISRGIAVVHNGTIENFRELANELMHHGFERESQTDTEIIAQLVAMYQMDGLSVLDSVKAAISRLKGAFAISLLFEGNGEHIIVAKQGDSPLLVGKGDGLMLVGSDERSLIGYASDVVYLESGQLGVISDDTLELTDFKGNPLKIVWHALGADSESVGKGNHETFMEKEIREQPTVLGDTLRSFFDRRTHQIMLPELPFDPEAVTALSGVACGTSSYSLLVAKYWLESIAGLPLLWDVASEFRYRSPVFFPGQAGIVVSQSGETVDTLGALRLMNDAGLPTLGIVNVRKSAIARLANGVLPTQAGFETSVASTKAFSTQLATLGCLTVGIARARGKFSGKQGKDLEQELTRALNYVPQYVQKVLELWPQLRGAAEDLVSLIQDPDNEFKNAVYVGRGTNFAVALEGALKLKEITYIPASAEAAGEIKHGPIALVHHLLPVVAIAPSDSWFDKTESNLQEIAARKGRILLLSDAQGVESLGDYCQRSITLPTVHSFITPIGYAVAVQILAYEVARILGRKVDKPRNLAKSVTVE